MSYVQLESGLIVPESCAPPRRPRALDLFCGAGGFSLGMEKGGFDVVAACDNDPDAAITYLVNLGAYPVQMYWLDDAAERRFAKAVERQMGRHRKGEIDVPPVSGSNRHRVCSPESTGCQHFFFGDVRNLRGEDVLRALGLKRGELDCVFGGPPCQGFSHAGKREVMDPRNSLVFEFARLVLEIHPKTMAMENVPGIRSMVTPDGLPVLDALARALEDGDFATLDALRKSLGIEGTRGAIRNRNGEPRSSAAVSAPAPAAPQLGLFSEVSRV